MDGFVPAYLLPLIRSALTYAPHGVLDARRAVDALDVRKALEAASAVAFDRILGRRQLHEFPITHVRVVAA